MTDAWPTAMPTIGRALTVHQELACALRILAAHGWEENLAGHITVALDDNTLLVNPWGMWWQEVRASDVVQVDLTSRAHEGRWDVTPAVFLHTELHRARPDALVVVHNHPYHATFLALIGETPTVSHQNSAVFANDVVFINEYDGTIESKQAGAALARRFGSASIALLANHGAIVTGASFGEACYRAVTFERACQFAVDAMRCERTLTPLPSADIPALKRELQRNTPDAFWSGAVRQLIAREPEVLT